MKKSLEPITLTAYHATTKTSAESIASNNFIIRFSAENWLGQGVYFFTSGISCPIQNALEWAKNSHPNSCIGIIRTTIEVNEHHLLDLRLEANLIKYNKTRNQIIEQHKNSLSTRRDLKIKKRRDIRLDDQIITSLIMEELDIKVLIHNVYIKNNIQRKLILESSYPNSTVCSVSDLNVITSNEVHCMTVERKNEHA